MKRKLLYVISKLDLMLAPITFLSSLVLASIRLAGIERMPISKKIFNRIGVFPISDHYYEPLFNTRALNSLSSERYLPGIDMNVAGQLDLLTRFTFQEELRVIESSQLQKRKNTFSFENGSFKSGDAEYLYGMVRYFKPKKIIEVGSGSSTLIVKNALELNRVEDALYKCAHICIEPYEAPWLEEIGVDVIRRRVEDVDESFFQSLEKGDILFIDSSHIIRPQGDVLFLYLEVIPILKPGVFIHIHDIFTPRDYLDSWIIDQVKFWNEQYLLEALLTDNNKIQIIGALNFLKHNYPKEISMACPILAEELATREPGSFWLLKK